MNSKVITFRSQVFVSSSNVAGGLVVLALLMSVVCAGAQPGPKGEDRVGEKTVLVTGADGSC